MIHTQASSQVLGYRPKLTRNRETKVEMIPTGRDLEEPVPVRREDQVKEAWSQSTMKDEDYFVSYSRPEIHRTMLQVWKEDDISCRTV